ncbi:YetF domain-containing protein, partial [Klebsiella pneumoniae]
QKSSGEFSYPVIVDGKVYTSVLHQLNVTESWLKNQLKKKGLERMNEIFFASINQNHELHVSLDNETTKIE